MGGFLGIGGSSAKTDRGRQLGGFNAEWNVFNSGFPFSQGQIDKSQSTTAQGNQTLADPLSYWKNILSGDRTAVSAATAPANNAVTDQADAMRRELAATGTARGGGTAGAQQQIQTRQRGKLADNVFAAQPAAAQGVTDIAKTQLNQGQQQMVQGLQALGLSLEAATAIVTGSTASRSQSYAQSPARAPEYLLGTALAGMIGGG